MKKILFALCAVLTLLSCEKAPMDTQEAKEEGNLILKFSAYEEQSFTRTATSVGDVFSKLTVMMFDGNNEKVFSKVKTQNADDENFGTMRVSVAAGTYTIIAVGHSTSKSATIDIDKVSFTKDGDKKITDTFYYYGTITVSEETEAQNIVMQRAAAMFRLQLLDETIPSGVTKFRFKYTGGSADFNPQTGFGVTNSTQEELRTVTSSSRIFEIFTFPKTATGKLKVTVTAEDDDANIYKTRIFTDVPVKANRITVYKGNFFDGTETTITPAGITFTADPEWGGTNEYEF